MKMPKFKPIFKKNFYLTIMLLSTILLGLFVINHLKQNTKTSIMIGGDFSLIDQNGEIFKSKYFKKKKLLYFGYTSCPDVCPFDLLKLSNLLDKNPILNKTLQSIFVSIDPDRDTTEVLKDYLDNFNPNIIGLTGSNEQINKIKKKFRIYVKLNKKNTKDTNYLVDHTVLFFLVNENDEYITHFRPNELESKIFKYI
tara:strand:- start:2324 stop:2914 length:591 start_codon:yes stop_codon:yes gene_type:complete